MTPVRRRRRQGQSLVEFALGGLLMVMLLAAATDLGRAYYTYIVVENMAGEGAQIADQNPDWDHTLYTDWSTAPIREIDTYQMRARNVAARVMGGIISAENVDPDTDVRIYYQDGDPSNNDTTNPSREMTGAYRCKSKRFNLKVAYHMNDLFFPGILGFRSLTIGATGPGEFVRSDNRATCP
jgi:Flp pilus assembly protein TadG